MCLIVCYYLAGDKNQQRAEQTLFKKAVAQ